MIASSILNSVTFKNLIGATLTTPVNATFTAGAGTLAAGTYYYRVTAVTANGETLPSTETSLVLASEGGVNVNWGAVAGATGYKIYGRSTGAELYLTTVSGATTFLDGGTLTPSGAMPTTNTTGTNGNFPNMWNTLHSARKQLNSRIIPYYQKFNKDHVLYLQFMSDSDSVITLKSFNQTTRAQIESVANAYTTHYGTSDNRYYTNFVITLDSDYYDKYVYFTATQGIYVLTSEPIYILDLSDKIQKGIIKYLKYTNLDRIESDLDNRFIDWSALTSTGNYLDFFIEALDVDLNDNDKSEVLEGSQSMTILSASYYTGKDFKFNPVPDYMIAKLGMIANLDVFMLNGLQYIKKNEIEAVRFGGSTLYQASLKLTQKNAIGINVDNLGIGESTPVIIPDNTTKMYIGVVTSASPDETEVKLMTELDAVEQTTTRTYYAVLGTRNCFAYPASFGDLSSAYVFSGFELLSAFVKTQVNFTFGTNTVLMNIYTFVSPITYVPDPPLEVTITYIF